MALLGATNWVTFNPERTTRPALDWERNPLIRRDKLVARSVRARNGTVGERVPSARVSILSA